MLYNLEYVYIEIFETRLKNFTKQSKSSHSLSNPQESLLKSLDQLQLGKLEKVLKISNISNLKISDVVKSEIYIRTFKTKLKIFSKQL